MNNEQLTVNYYQNEPKTNPIYAPGNKESCSVSFVKSDILLAKRKAFIAHSANLVEVGTRQKLASCEVLYENNKTENISVNPVILSKNFVSFVTFVVKSFICLNLVLFSVNLC